MTAEHISKGQPQDSFFCPIGLACRDAGLHVPSVDNGVIYSGPMRARIQVFLNSEARDFVRRFDLALPVVPFDLVVPDSLFDRKPRP